MRRRAYTLIEMLTVTAIIVVMAGITFPIVVSAKHSAQGRQSVSDMKQISIAVSLYREEWKRADYGDMETMGLPEDYPSLFGGSVKGLKPVLRPPVCAADYPFYYYLPLGKAEDARSFSWELASTRYQENTLLVCDPWFEGREPTFGWWRKDITTLPNRFLGISLGGGLLRKKAYGHYLDFALWK